jgi:hypothetical protein
LACVLGISPKKVPDFVNHKKGDDYVIKTRDWLRKKFNKSIVYIPVNQFMETSKIKYNPIMGPEGYSIMVIKTASEGTDHAVVAFHGGVIHDPTPLECTDFIAPAGFFVIYDL